MCILHHKSIRKHTCFKEIKEEKEEKVKKRLLLMKELDQYRATIAAGLDVSAEVLDLDTESSARSNPDATVLAI